MTEQVVKLEHRTARLEVGAHRADDRGGAGTPARRLGLVVLGVAVGALALKLYMAYAMWGTNDVGNFIAHAEAVNKYGPIAVYGQSLDGLVYNHPPLTGWYLLAIHKLAAATVIPFSFLIKLPAILGDVLTAVLVYDIVRRFRSPGVAAAAGIAVSVSPILLVISGFHGNTDPFFVAMTLLSLWLLLSRRSATLAGVAFAAALSVKLIPIVVLPVLLLAAWRGGPRRLAAYLAGSLATLALLWGPVLATNASGFSQKVLEYAGIANRPWGIVQLSDWVHAPASWVEFLIGPGHFAMVALAALIPAAIAWRRPQETPRAAALSLVLMLLLSTASATQYLAWAAAAALVVDVSTGLLYNLVGGAALVYGYSQWNGDVPPWRWNVADVYGWSAFEVRFLAVAWLTLLGVALAGLIPVRSRAVTAAGVSQPPTIEERPVLKPLPVLTTTGTLNGSGSSTRPPRIGVLVVTYNAAERLARTLDRIPVDFRSRITEVLVLDDASHDDTVRHGQLWAQRPDTPKTTVIRHTKNLGYGGNQKAGYALAIERGLDIIVLLHGDGQYAPEMLADMVAPLERGEADAVFGSRMMNRGGALRGGMPLYKWVGNKILTRIENRLLGTRLTEFHSGYRAYSVAALRELPLEHNTDAFDFDTQIIVQLVHAGKRILEIPIPTYYGDEISHVNGMRYAKDVIKDVLEYRLAAKGFGTTRWISKPDEYAFKEGDGSSHSIMLDMLKDAKPSRVLDVGCSGGLLAEHIRARGHHVVGVDYLEVPGVRERVDAFFQADLNNPLPPEVGNGYDVVIAGDIIEHLMRPGDALKEMRRVLRPGGQLLLSVPNFGHWYPRTRTTLGLFGYDRRGILDDTHLRFFTRRTLRRMVRSHGFDILKERATGLPLGTISEADGLRLKFMRAVDRLFVRLRPTLFGYQFVMRLMPHAEEAVVVEGP